MALAEHSTAKTEWTAQPYPVSRVVGQRRGQDLPLLLVGQGAPGQVPGSPDLPKLCEDEDLEEWK